MTLQEQCHRLAQKLRKNEFVGSAYRIERGLLIKRGCAALEAMDAERIHEFIKQYNDLARDDEVVRGRLFEVVFDIAQLAASLDD